MRNPFQSAGRSRGGGRRRNRSIRVDERARVPFALIGVLLLVTSSAYAAGLADQGLVNEDRNVERAVERADADATAALRAAAREAAHDTAAEPVTRAPSDSEAGSNAVRQGSAFTDAFRIRLAIAGKPKSVMSTRRCRSPR
jgi:triphosphoribosyl-dephospho-CoA synthetase